MDYVCSLFLQLLAQHYTNRHTPSLAHCLFNPSCVTVGIGLCEIHPNTPAGGAGLATGTIRRWLASRGVKGSFAQLGHMDKRANVHLFVSGGKSMTADT